MTAFATGFIGRFGNQLFQYAYARAFAEQNGHELRTTPWIGESIFTLGGVTHGRPDGTEPVIAGGYHQDQASLIYSRADCRRWFKIKPDLENTLRWTDGAPRWPHAHFRRGDYREAGYPVIGRGSVDQAVAEHMFPGDLRKNMVPGREYIAVSDEFPQENPELPPELSFLPDFYRLMRAPVLFRGNSSFSWWAATLGHGKVFAPIITGFAGGVEHDNIPYVEGNWPRLAELPDITDLHLREK